MSLLMCAVRLSLLTSFMLASAACTDGADSGNESAKAPRAVTTVLGVEVPVDALLDRDKAIVRFPNGVCVRLDRVPEPWRVTDVHTSGPRIVRFAALSEALGMPTNGGEMPHQTRVTMSIGAPDRNVYEHEFRRYRNRIAVRGDASSDWAALAPEYDRYERGSEILLVSKDATTVGICPSEGELRTVPNPFCRVLHFDDSTGDVWAFTLPGHSAGRIDVAVETIAEVARSIQSPCASAATPKQERGSP